MLGQQKSVGISGCNNDTWLANIVINERFILWNSGGSGFEAFFAKTVFTNSLLVLILKFLTIVNVL